MQRTYSFCFLGVAEPPDILSYRLHETDLQMMFHALCCVKVAKSDQNALARYRTPGIKTST